MEKYGAAEVETLLTELTMIVTHINRKSDKKDYKEPNAFILNLVEMFPSKEILMAYITSMKNYYTR